MLLSAATRPEALRRSGLRWWEDERFAIGWTGHLYLPGHAGGAPSVAGVAAALETADFAEVAARLAGVFGLFVFDKLRGGWQASVDNSGLYKVFHDAEGASTSFLELVKARRIGRADLDLAVLVEYLAQGQVLGSRTFVTGIERLSGREILELPRDGAPPRLRPKPLPDSEPGGTRTVLDRFAALARSLEGLALCVDATGGFDSRLIVCLLDGHALPFELATSGPPGIADAEIARTIARLLGRPFHLTGHDLGDLDAELVLTFRAGDGITDLRRFHRDWQHARARLARGIEVMAHGGGGELYRDHCFVQDFPFYGSRRVDLERYYNLRIAPAGLPPGALTPVGRELLAAARSSVLARLQGCLAPTNNETYDRVYFLLRSPEHFGQHCTNYVNMGLDVVAPLLDYPCGLAAIGLPPWSRFFYGWHRRVITARCPRLAVLPTADGFSASGKPTRMLRDAWWYGATQLRRAAKKASQRLSGKARFYNVGAFAADAADFMGRLRASPHYAAGLERLEATGILTASHAGEKLRDIHVGRVLTLGMFLSGVDGFA